MFLSVGFDTTAGEHRLLNQRQGGKKRSGGLEKAEFRADKSAAQYMEALRADQAESALADFHELRQGFSPR